MKKIIFCSLLILQICWSCSVENDAATPEIVTIDTSENTALPELNTSDLSLLPADNGGEYRAVHRNGSVLAHYLYLPGGYTDDTTSYPVFIFLHGAGLVIDSIVDDNFLDAIETPGSIAYYMAQHTANTPYPMIIIYPQRREENWFPGDVHEFIQDMIDTYNINPKRVYLSGISQGGLALFRYISTYGDTSNATAILPLAGGSNDPNFHLTSGRFRNTPVWAFHGQRDNIIPLGFSAASINSINSRKPEYWARITVFPEVGHDPRPFVFNNSGMGSESTEFTPFDMSIYEWMLRFKK